LHRLQDAQLLKVRLLLITAQHYQIRMTCEKLVPSTGPYDLQVMAYDTQLAYFSGVAQCQMSIVCRLKRFCRGIQVKDNPGCP
jgi:hypothetical protein